MSGVAVAAAVVGGGVSAYSANQQGGQMEDSVNGWNARMAPGLNDDADLSTISRNMYEFGAGNAYEDTDVPVYNSSHQTGQGYYYNHKRKMAINETGYARITRNGRKPIEGRWTVKDKDGNRIDKYEWIPGKLKGATYDPAGNLVSAPEGQMSLEEKQLAYANKMQPDVQKYQKDLLAAAQGLLPKQTEVQDAALQAALDTGEGKVNALNATNLYTTNTLPQKTNAVTQALALAGRNTEAEAARMAGAEVSQAFNTKQKTLGESIRRTGAVAGSGRMAGLQEDLDINRVKATAGARIASRTQARESQFDQLSKAIQYI